MNNIEKKCEECGKQLKPSQYGSIKREGEPAKKVGEDLVCRNYPDCPKAEMEVDK
jgi:hypothetical protein